MKTFIIIAIAAVAVLSFFVTQNPNFLQELSTPSNVEQALQLSSM